MVTGTRVPNAGFWMIGWMASAAYHGALTWLFVFYLPGTLKTSGSSTEIPLSLLSGAACVASLCLLIRYPRPPRLPPSEPTPSAKVLRAKRVIYVCCRCPNFPFSGETTRGARLPRSAE